MRTVRRTAVAALVAATVTTGLARSPRRSRDRTGHSTCRPTAGASGAGVVRVTAAEIRAAGLLRQVTIQSFDWAR